MRLNRIVSLMLSCLMLLMVSYAAAQEEDSDVISPLSVEEIAAFTQQVLDLAKAQEPIVTPEGEADLTEDGYAFIYDFGTLYLNHPQMGEDAALLSFVITGEDVKGPRESMVGQTVQELLASFTSENPALSGDYNHAVLYLYDELPLEAVWAWVARDGQRVQSVQYSVFAAYPEGEYTDTGVLYTVQGGLVDAIRVYGLTERISEADVRDTLNLVRASLVSRTYESVPTSFDGLQLTAFDAADLRFSGFDFASATPEDAIARFGEAIEDNLMTDSDGSQVRLMDFGDCEIFFRTDKASGETYVSSLTVASDGLEGPRAIRVGDTFASVLSRFRFGEGEYTDGIELLYGSTESYEYGICEYGDNASATLRYFSVDEKGEPVELLILFENMELSEYLLLRL